MNSFTVLLRRFSHTVWLRTRWGALTGRSLLDLALIVVGAGLTAVSVVVFLNPNDVVPGGFTALAMFANRLWGWPVGITLLVMNVPFLLLAMHVLGMQFGPKTILATALASLLIDVLQPYLPVVQGDPLLYTLYGGLIYGVGLGLVFRANATTGGSEIPAKLLEHWRGVRMSTSLLAMDAAVLVLAAFFFGLEPALYALIVAWVAARVIDFMETGATASITALIVTRRPESIRAGILEQARARRDPAGGQGRLHRRAAHRADGRGAPPRDPNPPGDRAPSRPRCLRGDQPQRRGAGRGLQAADACAAPAHAAVCPGRTAMTTSWRFSRKDAKSVYWSLRWCHPKAPLRLDPPEAKGHPATT